jgi:hypothetical protein
MSGDTNLLHEGLAALATMLPDGCSVAPSSLSKRTAEQGDWIVLRQGAKHVTCLLLSRRRVEPRDLGAIAAGAGRSSNPALLVSSYLTPAVRERLRGFGIGHWDLAGNVRINIPAIQLQLAAEGTGVGKTNPHSVRSLCGEMAGRIARALVDVAPPYALGTIAEIARVEPSYVSRVLSYLTETGIVRRKPRGMVEIVDWPQVLRRWTLDAPRETRGEQTQYTRVAGLPDFLDHLSQSGYLHALTGELAMAKLMGHKLPSTAVLYVDNRSEAVAQFRLHPSDHGPIVLITPADRSIYQRSTEKAGLRCVSPSLIAADLPNAALLEQFLTWMRAHQAAWRQPSSNFESDKGSNRGKSRRKEPTR